MCISDDWFYQSIYSFWAHKHTVKNSPQKLQQFTPHFKILDPRVDLKIQDGSEDDGRPEVISHKKHAH